MRQIWHNTCCLLYTIPVRTAFFGTPAIAVPALRALNEITNVAAVVCQPDRPAGRGLQLSVPPVRAAAEALGLPVFQPVKVRTGNLDEWLKELGVELSLVMAYGRILPQPVLAAPRLGFVNLHASLLPKFRGAAPINWALVAGEQETGISLMQMDAGMDTGPVYTEHRMPIGPEQNAGELADCLASLAAEVVRRDLPRLIVGGLEATPQDPRQVSYAPPITKEHARIDWSRPNTTIHDLVRGMAPRPGAYTSLRGKHLRVLRARPSLSTTESPESAEPGLVSITKDRRVLISTGNGTLELLNAQLEGRKALEALDLVNGRMLAPGDHLGR